MLRVATVWSAAGEAEEEDRQWGRPGHGECGGDGGEGVGTDYGEGRVAYDPVGPALGCFVGGDEAFDAEVGDIEGERAKGLVRGGVEAEGEETDVAKWLKSKGVEGGIDTPPAVDVVGARSGSDGVGDAECRVAKGGAVGRAEGWAVRLGWKGRTLGAAVGDGIRCAVVWWLGGLVWWVGKFLEAF